METYEPIEPDPDEARGMLVAASDAEGATVNPPLPWSFFVTQASLLAAICVAQMIPSEVSRILTVLGMLAIVGMGIRGVFYRPGYGVVWPDGPGMFPYMIAMFVAVGIPAVLAIALEVPWLWLIAAALAAAATLEMGRRYRKAATRA